MYDRDVARVMSVASQMGVFGQARVDFWSEGNSQKKQVNLNDPIMIIDEDKKTITFGSLKSRDDATGEVELHNGKNDFCETVALSEIFLSGRPKVKKTGQNGAYYSFQIGVSKKFFIFFYAGHWDYTKGENPADSDAYVNMKKAEKAVDYDASRDTAAISDFTEADFTTDRKLEDESDSVAEDEVVESSEAAQA